MVVNHVFWASNPSQTVVARKLTAQSSFDLQHRFDATSGLIGFFLWMRAVHSTAVDITVQQLGVLFAEAVAFRLTHLHQ